MPADSPTVKLSNGLELRFAPLSVYDSVKFRERFGRNIEALGNELVTDDELDKMEGMIFLAYRSATAGGYEGSEEDFQRAIPLVGDDLAKIMEAVTAFFGGPPGSAS